MAPLKLNQCRRSASCDGSAGAGSIHVSGFQGVGVLGPTWVVLTPSAGSGGGAGGGSIVDGDSSPTIDSPYPLQCFVSPRWSKLSCIHSRGRGGGGRGRSRIVVVVVVVVVVPSISSSSSSSIEEEGEESQMFPKGPPSGLHFS